jgi:hypothetical protein
VPGQAIERRSILYYPELPEKAAIGECLPGRAIQVQEPCYATINENKKARLQLFVIHIYIISLVINYLYQLKR